MSLIGARRVYPVSGSLTEEQRSYYETAYRVADDAKENVFIIWVPRSGLTYQSGLPYIVQASVADTWEATSGEVIQWRYK